VTGAAGYLGAEVVRRAGAAGWDVVAAVHTRPAVAGTPLRIDLRDPVAAAERLRAAAPSAVVHTAYLEHGRDRDAVNVAGSRAVARAAGATGARLVHVSTDLVFDGTLGRPYTEDDEARPITEYGRQKLAGEEAVREALPSAVVVRTSLIYGGAAPSRHERVVLDAADGAAPARFFSDELRSPVQVGDLAAALLRLAASDAAGVLHAAGADGVSRYEFARLVAAAAGRDPDQLESALASQHSDPRPIDCRLDSSRARAREGIELRGAREVLARPRTEAHE
jgi:dTDP-4-dehydrorhamnose reductase